MSDKKKISAVISAYNEEDKIEKCLKSVEFADEIILIDNSSTDKTAAIARKYTSKIFTCKNNPMLNVNKNFGFEKVENGWILNLDADEQVTPELEEEIKSVLDQVPSSVNGFWIPRKNIIFGKWIKSDMWWPDYQLRLFRKGKGSFAEKHVHEYVQVTGETLKLKECINHDNYSSVSQYLQKMDKIYTENEAENIITSNRKITWVDAIRFPAQDFLKTFFAQKGYKDGLHGLVLSILQAFYAEVVFAKVWESKGFKEENDNFFLREVYREFRRAGREFRYWFLTSTINETKNPLIKIIHRILRKTTRTK